MDSGFLGHAAKIVGVFGAIGLFIDFYIGPANQERVRDWFETWWLKLSDVQWANFGREEAVFVVHTMDRLVGRRMLSLRRLWAVLAAVGVSAITAGISCYLSEVSHISVNKSFLATFICSIVLFSISVSLTRAAAVGISSMITARPALNLVGFVTLVLVQYAMLCSMPLVIQSATAFTTVYSLSKITPEIWFYQLRLWTLEIISAPFNPAGFFNTQLRIYTTALSTEFGQDLFEARASNTLALLPSLGRILIGLTFVGMNLLLTIRGPIFTLWARVVESKKPVFTLLFGGAALLTETVRHIASL